MTYPPLQTTREELREGFRSLACFADLAALLKVRKSTLYYFAFKADFRDQYHAFEIPKRTGGARMILAPRPTLKALQKRLSQVLGAVYVPKKSVHGFVANRSILTNATAHVGARGRKRYILNADLEDFFPTITSYRVANLLKARPYQMNPAVAVAIAHLVCAGRSLPQGAPSSPVISNMICSKLDSMLTRLAKDNNCFYTRYADDITISTALSIFPSGIAEVDLETGVVNPGEDLNAVVRKNGFHLNLSKLRLQGKYGRQVITGLTVNERPNVPRRYVSQVRAMLHAWETYGEQPAQIEYQAKYSRRPGEDATEFRRVVRGKLEFLRMVRGADNPEFCKYSEQLARLDESYSPPPRRRVIQNPLRLFIMTEGPSDWKHLKAALQYFRANHEYDDLNIEFDEDEGRTRMGDGNLQAHLKLASKDRQPSRTEICIFDRDKPDVVRQVSDGNSFKTWNQRVYSFALPVPSHREATPGVCIELYYRDDEIQRMDEGGHRLFLSTEFHEFGRHRTEKLWCQDPGRLQRGLTVIDNSVVDFDGREVALPKNRFASNVLNQETNFNDMDFSKFRLVFDMIHRIAEAHERTVRAETDGM